MPVTRMRMRPWLEVQIESQEITGLNWMDKEKTMFSIPWKHAARHGWEMDKDACLFKRWAVHTGKFTEGMDADPKTWKANFRCAMNSLPDIDEVKDRSVNKGHGAVRVFRMLPLSPKSRDKQSRAKDAKSKKTRTVVKMEENMDCSDSQSSTQENTVDSTVRMEKQDYAVVNPLDLPEWASSVEISSSFEFPKRFQVSPDHSSFDDDTDYNDVIRICQELERDQLNLDDMGFLANEACTSPGSQWSETSGSDLDDMPQYTTLGSDTLPTDPIWSNFFPIL